MTRSAKAQTSRGSRPVPSAAGRVAQARLPSATVEGLATIFKMLGNANRLNLLVFLADRERNVSDMERVLAIKQPTLSQQLGALRDAGLILGRREAKSAIYRLTPGSGKRAVATIYSLLALPVTLEPTSQQHPSLSRASRPAAVFASIFKS